MPSIGESALMAAQLTMFVCNMILVAYGINNGKKLNIVFGLIGGFAGLFAFINTLSGVFA